MNEEWRPIRGWEGKYYVSNMGRIRNRNGLILRPEVTKQGYLRVKLKNRGHVLHARVHRLVAEAFVPNPEGKPCINHINEHKDDNRAENLVWCTVAENNAYGEGAKIRLLHTKQTQGMRIKATRNGRTFYFLTIRDAAKAIGGASTSIRYALKHGNEYRGYLWQTN